METSLSRDVVYLFSKMYASMLLFLCLVYGTDAIPMKGNIYDETDIKKKFQKRDEAPVVNTVANGLSDVSPLLSLLSADNMEYVATSAIRDNGASLVSASGAIGSLGAAQAGLKVGVGRNVCERVNLDYGTIVDLQTDEVERATSAWLQNYPRATLTETRWYHLDVTKGVFQGGYTAPLIPSPRAHLVGFYSVDGVSCLSEYTIGVYNSNLRIFAIKYSITLILVGGMFSLIQLPLVFNGTISLLSLLLSTIGATGVAVVVVLAAVRNKQIGNLGSTSSSNAILKIDEYDQDGTTIHASQVIFDNVYEAISQDKQRGIVVPLILRIVSSISAVMIVGGFIIQLSEIPPTTTDTYLWYGIQLGLVVVRWVWLIAQQKTVPTLSDVQMNMDLETICTLSPLKDTPYCRLLRHGIEHGTIRIGIEYGFTITICDSKKIPVRMRELWVPTDNPKFTWPFRSFADVEGLKGLALEPQGPGIHFVVQARDQTMHITSLAGKSVLVAQGKEGGPASFREIEGRSALEWFPPLNADQSEWAYAQLTAGNEGFLADFDEKGDIINMTEYEWDPTTDRGTTIQIKYVDKPLYHKNVYL